MKLVSVFAVLTMMLGSGIGASILARNATPATASPLEIPLLDVAGEEAGMATFEESGDGMVMISVTVEGLAPGEHGIHIHETGT